MDTYCGADCGKCGFKENCKGCLATCGSPFGGRCVAAEYIKLGGMEAYQAFKKQLTEEVNALLAAEGFPPAEGLNELTGAYVNLEYPLPGGGKAKFLDDKNIYLGAQVELPGLPVCVGVVADLSFILICRYGDGGSDPELVIYKKR